MSNELAYYDAACAALDAAVTANEVMTLRATAEGFRAAARMAKNLDFEIKAIRLRTEAEMKLGDMLQAAAKDGLLRGGRDNCSAPEQLERIKLSEVGIDRKLSSHAQKISGIGQRAMGEVLKRFETESTKRGRVALDVIRDATAKRNTESRRMLAEELSEASAILLPTGRKFPVIYADPPWKRKAGIGNRAYENHYSTMSWSDILTMPVVSRALDDAWLFLWIPRAHLMALHPTVIETQFGATMVKLPLAYAVAQAWGFPQYSTCFVWTKTDETHPDDHGSGLIVWDQDEILCLFKRGRGLPMPDGKEKVGSNYRARATEHSVKPSYYREMINRMTGTVPVLELFAREDDEHELPDNFYTWGNQSRNTAELQEPHGML